MIRLLLFSCVSIVPLLTELIIRNSGEDQNKTEFREERNTLQICFPDNDSGFRITVGCFLFAFVFFIFPPTMLPTTNKTVVIIQKNEVELTSWGSAKSVPDAES